MKSFFPYSNQSDHPFKINLTASCNFGCECDINDVQPVCGSNGLTYFSPCHAGCTSLGSTSDNYTNCACKLFVLSLAQPNSETSRGSMDLASSFEPSTVDKCIYTKTHNTFNILSFT